MPVSVVVEPFVSRPVQHLLRQAATPCHNRPPECHIIDVQGQLYNLTSKYGNEEQLIELNKTLKDAGIMPLADIVINHRCACEQARTMHEVQQRV